MVRSASLESRITGGLLAACLGDALGLPYEGVPRQRLDEQPVVGMAETGRRGLPAGTWSDDSSLLFCLADSLCDGYDPADIAERFLDWWHNGVWTPWGETFGYGRTTAAAMQRLDRGAAPLEAGLNREGANGNGSLMRTLPVALCFSLDRERMLRTAHEVSSITHAHPRSQMCCGIYCLVASCLLEGLDRREAVEGGVGLAGDFYHGPPWEEEREHLATVFSLDVTGLDRFQVRSGGYVVETLEAALWCLVRGESLKHSLLAAVNLGGDTDTVACVTGGLAGVHYGQGAAPEEWESKLARRQDILQLCSRFWDAVRRCRRS
jgi:ADP-ribosylglycohydrolase